MKGLMIKDFVLLFLRKRYFALLAIISIGCSFSMEGFFAIHYMALLGLIMSMSVMNYEEYDNSILFTMTLPFSRKEFVLEKYVFSYFSGFIFLLAGLIIQSVILLFTGSSSLLFQAVCSSLSIIPIILILPAFMIPVQIKFGNEKSKIILMIFAGSIAALIAAFVSISTKGENSAFSSIINFFVNYKTGVLTAAIVLLIAIIPSSILISLKIMNKKEF